MLLDLWPGDSCSRRYLSKVHECDVVKILISVVSSPPTICKVSFIYLIYYYCQRPTPHGESIHIQPIGVGVDV